MSRLLIGLVHLCHDYSLYRLFSVNINALMFCSKQKRNECEMDLETRHRTSRTRHAAACCGGDGTQMTETKQRVSVRG